MSSISAREYHEWYVYDQIYGPIGYERSDMGSALIAERLTNLMIRRRKDSPAAKASDFMPSPNWGWQDGSD